MLSSTTRLLALTAALAGTLFTATAAEAQVYRRRPIVVRKSPLSTLRTLVDRTERESNALRNSFERRYSEYRLNRLPAGERAKENVQEMDEAFERLRGRVDDSNPARGRDEMRKVIRQANDVDTIFGNHPEITAVVRGQWRSLREDINQLARYYGLSGLGRTGSRPRR